MKDEDKTRDQLIDELVELRRRGAELEASEVEHKQAAEALRESEEKFRTFVEKANDIVYSLTLDGMFMYASPNWTEILGHEISEVMGQSFVPFVHPDDVPRCVAFLEGVAAGKKQAGIEYRVKHKNGSWRWHTSNASPVKDEEGKVVSYLGIARDITERKQMETQLMQAEKMASLGMLVAGVAHEINTPVAAISSMHDTLVRAVERSRSTLNTMFTEESDERQKVDRVFKVIEDANRVIASGTERVANIVRRLKTFARLDEAELKQVDIHEGIEDTLTMVHHELKNKVVIERSFGDVPPISCYPSQLNQVFLNLLINAIQAIEDEGTITITTLQKDDHAYIQFRDTGVGIPDEALARIFVPGYTTKDRGTSTGLGLSICHQIVRDHNGNILVESEVGKGTIFTIVLPMTVTPENH